jgi:16S rRNA (cytidine1402-2'-O)-methyltransferase
MLYVCATPIGNLKDISLRAIEILEKSDIILCEDTRLSMQLLNAHQIKYKKLVALHEHNENEVAEKVIQWLNDDLIITQISDAGTPNISDPGARLCNLVRENGFAIAPIPGACAYISLLSVSGIDCKSLFYGFLPATTTKRKKILQTWQDVDYAVCIYEAPHRIVECVTDIIECLGNDRSITMGRELTKQFETIKKMPVGELLHFIDGDSNQRRGEFVLIISPNVPQKSSDEVEQLSALQINTLNLLAVELPPKKAVQLTNKIVGGNKDLLYKYLCDA